MIARFPAARARTGSGTYDYGTERDDWIGEAGLEAGDHVERERRRPCPVDDAVVEGDRDVADLADDDLAVANDGARADPVQAEDRHLGMVDERRHEEAAELARARDVKVPPRSSSGLSVPARAASASRSTSAASSSSEAVSQPRTTGTTSPWSVCTATPKS